MELATRASIIQINWILPLPAIVYTNDNVYLNFALSVVHVVQMFKFQGMLNGWFSFVARGKSQRNTGYQWIRRAFEGVDEQRSTGSYSIFREADQLEKYRLTGLLVPPVHSLANKLS